LKIWQIAEYWGGGIVLAKAPGLVFARCLLGVVTRGLRTCDGGGKGSVFPFLMGTSIKSLPDGGPRTVSGREGEKVPEQAMGGMRRPGWPLPQREILPVRFVIGRIGSVKLLEVIRNGLRGPFGGEKIQGVVRVMAFSFLGVASCSLPQGRDSGADIFAGTASIENPRASTNFKLRLGVWAICKPSTLEKRPSPFRGCN